MRAFINGCRNVVGLDGCHLKGKYGGCLLSATALDGQNGLVPLGIMICKNECAENWFLFLKHLKPRLDEHPVQGINFISDRQKGLREAVHKLFPTSPHRFCFRHMYKNFKSHFKGSKLHTMFWNAAKAYKAKHFQAHMDSMMVENVKAFEYLMGENPKSWCRAFFDHNSSCEHLSNNFSESFNNMIAKIREKPLCKLVLMYGQLVMGLFYNRRNACVGWDSGDLVPSAKKLLKLMLKKLGEYKVAGAVADKVYEVTSIHSSVFTVDLNKKTCSCVQWQLRGFPCQHAVCALQQIRPNWIQYCAKYYSVDNYKITYAEGMIPLEGPDDWEEPRVIIVPPLLIRKQGRPRKNRRKAYDETLHEKKPRCCSKCKQPGHNKTTCGGGPIGSNSTKKRIRLEVDG
ncbi:MULE domain-containing protein [Heracleum sosnowskyi]|uniref:MULE domain-containing protein n=1 Tax=Heracleum sosnowskyi TaxID=360622 RepID=A0AAD8LXS5_9APIA|nr:MULE domain-containing protein [Heracleum sosnowskyi]